MTMPAGAGPRWSSREEGLAGGTDIEVQGQRSIEARSDQTPTVNGHVGQAEAEEEPKEEGEVGEFSLWLRMGANAPPIGAITRVADQTTLSFRGWMQFMAVVDLLRTGPQVTQTS